MDENHLTTKDVADLFDVSHQTVKVWARKFADYLSATARPETGKRRVFVSDDLSVFALIKDYTGRGYTFEDAELALTSGQRGTIPEKAGQLETVPPAALVIKLRADIVALQEELQRTTQVSNQKDGQITLLRELLEDREKKIEQLMRQNARFEAERDKNS
jgi:DNA-binding transcriptional MerR regulator